MAVLRSFVEYTAHNPLEFERFSIQSSNHFDFFAQGAQAALPGELAARLDFVAIVYFLIVAVECFHARILPFLDYESKLSQNASDFFDILIYRPGSNDFPGLSIYHVAAASTQVVERIRRTVEER